MTKTFLVVDINDGPAPYDVIARDTDGSTELRLRFDDHPGISVGAEITIEYEQDDDGAPS